MELSLDLSGPWTALKDATAVRAESGRPSMTVEVLAHSEKTMRDCSQKQHAIRVKYDDVYTL